jgi:hypothetical protein
VTAGEIAVIGPGFDAIARYTLAEILVNQGIPVASLNDQRPLVSTPLVRAILTLMPLVYPGLGRWVDRDAIAEMLVVLSQSATGDPHRPWIERVQIDPVRAELITDHCFRPDPDRPDLLPVTEFPRWDRLGYQATEAYNRLCQWIQEQRQALQQRLIATPVNFIDRAIQAFLWRGNYLPADQLAALRELLETAQHFWQVEERLRQQQMAQPGVGWAFTPLPSPGGGAAPELAPLPTTDPGNREGRSALLGPVAARHRDGESLPSQAIGLDASRGHPRHRVSISRPAAHPPLAVLAGCGFTPLAHGQ